MKMLAISCVFNAMQAILLNILQILFSLIMGVLIPAFGGQSLISETLTNTIFMGSIAACFFVFSVQFKDSMPNFLVF